MNAVVTELCHNNQFWLVQLSLSLAIVMAFLNPYLARMVQQDHNPVASLNVNVAELHPGIVAIVRRNIVLNGDNETLAQLDHHPRQLVHAMDRDKTNDKTNDGESHFAQDLPSSVIHHENGILL